MVPLEKIARHRAERSGLAPGGLGVMGKRRQVMDKVSIADIKREANESTATKLANGGALRAATPEEMEKLRAEGQLQWDMEKTGIPQAMTGAEAALSKAIHEDEKSSVLDLITLNIRTANHGRREIQCHHYCFYSNEVHLYHVRSGRLAKFSRITNVESVEEIG